MNNTVKTCDSCNSEVITVKRGINFSVECSYCGKSYESGYEISDFLPEYDGAEE